MNTEKAKMKWSDFKGAFVLAAISFGIAAFFIYLAYVGMVTGTTLRTKSYPRSVPHGRGEQQYAGVYTRDENPRQFWFAETMFSICAVIFVIGGMQPLWEKYKEYRQEKLLELHHHKTN